MKPTRKELERAIEMAVVQIIKLGVCPRRQATILCGDFSECQSKGCLRANKSHFIKQAQAKGRKE